MADPALRQRLSGLRRAVAVLVCLAAIFGGFASVAAAEDEPEAEPLPDWLILPDPRLHPRLLRLNVSSPGFDDEVATYEYLRTALADAREAIAAADTERAVLELDRRSLERTLDDLRARHRESLRSLDEIRAAIRQLAIASYMGSGTQAEDEVFSLNAGNVVIEARRETFVAEVRDGQGGRQEQLAAIVDELTAAISQTQSDLASVNADIVALDAESEDHARIAYVALEAVPDSARRVREARLRGTVRGADMPLIALDAYVKAAEALAEERPSCGIAWWALAGIGRVESNHGRFAGTTLDVNGDTDQAIIGVPLDGQEGLALISDSDGGLYDGDPVLDRAVGPMQFIPQTWVRYESDGNDDELMDPNNIYDATLAAARYLCAVGVDMRVEEGMRRAFFAYNHHDEYVEAVYTLAIGFSGIALASPVEVDFEALAAGASEVRVRLPGLGLGFLGGAPTSNEISVVAPSSLEEIDFSFLDDER